MEHIKLLSEFSRYLKERKERENKKIIAFMGHDNIPEEIIDAAGLIPLRMSFAGTDELMSASNDYLPASTCSFAQTCIGLYSQKPRHYEFLNLVDYFIVSNHCVSDICVSEIITKYFNIPRLNFYMAYTQNSEALKYFKIELLDLKKQLENIIGREISNEDIIKSIKKYNRFKIKLSEVQDLKIIGSEKLDIFQKAILYGPSYMNNLENIITELKSKKSEFSKQDFDLIFTGCSMFIGDYLINLIEEAGGNIIFFDTWIGYNYYSQVFTDDQLNSKGDAIDLLVMRFENNKFGDHSVPNFLEHKVTQIKQLIEEYEQKTGKRAGVINHIIKFCDHINIFQTFLKEKLQEEGIKFLNLERDYSRANRGQLSTRIEAFMEMMR
ncbi:MAG: 2-hydroxyacyl-CoA dehydratase family protein [Promethearchaeota archaeon]